ncbi:molybdopterin-dependent oxidoreductase [Thermodesulfobacteriota bacterium]
MSNNRDASDRASGLLARLGDYIFGESAGALIEKAWPGGIKEDKWLYTGCRSCTQPRCGMKVRRINGIITEVEGDPDHPMTAGTLCVRGQGNAGNLYNPYRVKAPMKRTNPEKGADVDPGWMEISWEEAMDTIVDKLKEVLDTDPRQLLVMVGFGSFGDDLPTYREAFPKAFGTPNIIENNGNLCAVHYGTLTFHGEFVKNLDMERCNYLIACGFTPGSRFVSAAGETRATENAKERGMKMVVVDPHYSSDAQRGEWVPIRPATDLAFQLAFIHVMLHELNRYDEWFVKNRTDCP